MPERELRERLRDLVAYVARLEGRERAEAQVFCDRLFRAFGHEGYREAGAVMERPVRRRGQPAKFADLLWSPHVLIEMKSRGADLRRHYRQAFEYWIGLVPDRPEFVVLCNFDEFWIYDFNTQLDVPLDEVRVEELPDRFTALNFLRPEGVEPQFGNNRVAVTKEAATQVGAVYRSLIERDEEPLRARRFVLQCLMSMFAEDFNLLPQGLFTQLVRDCLDGESSYDLLGTLFRQMNQEEAAGGGRFTEVRYFNGGLFSTTDPIDLEQAELELLLSAAEKNWTHVQPAVFGSVFQASLSDDERHREGAHFTSEADIQKVVLPTIVRPWRERIHEARRLRDLQQLLDEIRGFRVLDPACGSGNFLYVAYRELVNLELEILARVHEGFARAAQEAVGATPLIATTQFHGIDRDPFAVELARVTMMLAKRVALREVQESPFAEQRELPLEFESPLPLDNLDEHIVCDDALFCRWPEADAIIGNPPFQSKNKMQEELGAEYVRRVRARYPSVPGRADYCVYWFRRSHDEMRPGVRAGLVGTNTIRQNNSREGGLGYITANGGTITEAVASQVWPGDAAVHVSIVNWIKGEQDGRKRLFRQLGDQVDSPWEVVELDWIGPALAEVDVSGAAEIAASLVGDTCRQGQTPGHRGFVRDLEKAKELVAQDPAYGTVMHPFLTAQDMLRRIPPAPSRAVIDFTGREIVNCANFTEPFGRVSEQVLPDRQAAAVREDARNRRVLEADPDARVNRHHQQFLDRWWQLSWGRADLIARLRGMDRYIVCSRVSRRPVFEFVSGKVNPGDSLQVFLFGDDYSFGVLQSDFHWQWFMERCSTLKRDYRYTSESVYRTFPWPQGPTEEQVASVADAAVALREVRAGFLAQGVSLQHAYRLLELPGRNPLRTAHRVLDESVRGAYGFAPDLPTLSAIFDLGQDVAQREADGEPVAAPGPPAGMAADLIRRDGPVPILAPAEWADADQA